MKKVTTFTEWLSESEDLNESTDLASYEKLMKKHDWYYMMSDDDRSWSTGKKEETEIEKVYAGLSEQDKREAYALFVEMHKKFFPYADHEVEFSKFTGI